VLYKVADGAVAGLEVVYPEVEAAQFEISIAFIGFPQAQYAAALELLEMVLNQVLGLERQVCAGYYVVEVVRAIGRCFTQRGHYCPDLRYCAPPYIGPVAYKVQIRVLRAQLGQRGYFAVNVNEYVAAGMVQHSDQAGQKLEVIVGQYQVSEFHIANQHFQSGENKISQIHS